MTTPFSELVLQWRLAAKERCGFDGEVSPSFFIFQKHHLNLIRLGFYYRATGSRRGELARTATEQFHSRRC